MTHKVGDLQVFWVPQVPMKAFEVGVSSIEEAVKIMETLADYDAFQYENRIKPDYCNTGWLSRWVSDSNGEGNPGWEDWYDEESGIDDPRKYLESIKL